MNKYIDIKQVTGFQTRDGMIFSSIEIAREHEYGLIKREIEQEFKDLVLELNPLIIKAREKINEARMMLGDDCKANLALPLYSEMFLAAAYIFDKLGGNSIVEGGQFYEVSMTKKIHEILKKE